MTPPQSSSSEFSQSPTVGVLLIHGFNGGLYDMEELTGFLAARGMITKNMLLPGHGLRVRDLLPLGWSDWEEAVYSELRTLKQRCDVVFLVGHSLGGALALHVAAHEEVGGVVSMCAPLHLHPLTRQVVRVIKYITPLLPALREDARDPATHRRWTPTRPVESVMRFLPALRTELPQITAPVLIMTSTFDHVVPARDGREIYHLLGSREKHLVTFHRSHHVIMKDRDSAEVFAKTFAFIRRHAGKVTPRRDNADQTA